VADRGDRPADELVAGRARRAVLPLPAAPAYGGASLPDLVPSIAAAMGLPGSADLLGLGQLRRVCLLLVDGLGWSLLREHRDRAPFLASLLPAGRSVSAGFPATTATSLASVGTGRPPGEHGLLGYQVAIPGTGRVLNALRWDRAVDPYDWQPGATMFDRLAGAGVAVSQIGPGSFRNSGLTVAALRGATYRPAETPGDVVAQALAAVADGERTLAYAYHADLDKTGHLRGAASAAWGYQLAHVDRLAEQLAAGLPPDATLVIIADHGMVDVAPADRIDVEADPELAAGVALLAGEPRVRYVHALPGAAGDVLAAWRCVLDGTAWVVSRDEAIAAGWFGPRVADGFRERIGDVVAACAGPVALVAPRAEPRETRLIGVHGSLTPAEQLVPLLRFP